MLLRAVGICCGDERPCMSPCKSQWFLAIQSTGTCSAFCSRSCGCSVLVPRWSLRTLEKNTSSHWIWSGGAMYFIRCETEPRAGKLLLCYECPPFVSHFQLLDNIPKAMIYQGHCPLSSWEADSDLSVWQERQWLRDDLYETVVCRD